MVRAENRPPALARFERNEADGRSHSAWILTAEVGPDGAGTSLTMHLHYGGVPWLPLVERLLADDIRRAGDRLERLLG